MLQIKNNLIIKFMQFKQHNTQGLSKKKKQLSNTQNLNIGISKKLKSKRNINGQIILMFFFKKKTFKARRKQDVIQLNLSKSKKNHVLESKTNKQNIV